MDKLLETFIYMLNPKEEEIQQLRKVISRFPALQDILGEMTRELNTPPRIALLGKAGAGKSSTINALFNPHPLLDVGVVRPVTMVPTEVTVPLGGRRGAIAIIDGPGVGATKRIDNEIRPMYEKLLPDCDLILWIIKADDRALKADQEFIEEVVPDALKKRLVVGISQVDKICPGDWQMYYNLPSEEQEKYISEKKDYVWEVLNEIHVRPLEVVPYSALYGYRLVALAKVMLATCAKTRGWVLRQKMKPNIYQSPAKSEPQRSIRE